MSIEERALALADLLLADSALEDPRHEAAAQLRARGLGQKRISEEIGCTNATVCTWLQLPSVDSRVRYLQAVAARDTTYTAREWFESLARTARIDPRRILQVATGQVSLEDLSVEEAQQITEYSEGETKYGTNRKVKRLDPMKAREMLGKALGTFELDNRQRAGAGLEERDGRLYVRGRPVEEVRDDELEAEMAHYEAIGAKEAEFTVEGEPDEQ